MTVYNNDMYNTYTYDVALTTRQERVIGNSHCEITRADYGGKISKGKNE